MQQPDIQDVLASMPLLASVLGNKYGIDVQIQGDTAYTDGTCIHLPALPVDGSAEFLCMLRAFLDHESAHIRETDFSILQTQSITSLEKHIWNSLEDYRVEQKLAACFPGCKENLHWLVEHLFIPKQKEAGPTSPAFSVLNWILLAVRAFAVPSLAPVRDKEAQAVEAAFPGLLPQLESILVRFHANCPDSQACLDYTKEIVQVLEIYVDNYPQQPKSAFSEEKSSAISRTENWNSGKFSECFSQNDLEEKSEASQKSKRGKNKQVSAEEDLQNLLHALHSALPQDVGNWLQQQLCKSIAENAKVSERICVARASNLKPPPLPARIKAEALSSSTALRTRLHGLLQASSLSPVSAGRRGKLNPARLHGVFTHNPKIFLREGENKKVDTAVHLLLDTSGSMNSRIRLATSACYAVAQALSLCQGVNLGVTAFPADSLPASKVDEVLVTPLVRHGERMHNRFSLGAQGGTPLGPALWWVLQQMQFLKEPRKIILLLSDGSPDSFTAAKRALSCAKRQGVEVLGLGIMCSMKELLPESRSINDMQELAPVLFAMLQKALLAKNG